MLKKDYIGKTRIGLYFHNKKRKTTIAQSNDCAIVFVK